MAVGNAVGVTLKLLSTQSGADINANAACALAAVAAAVSLHLDLVEARGAHTRALETGLLTCKLCAALATV